MNWRRPLDTIPRRLVGSMVAYLILLTLVVIAFTAVSNERAEKFAWTTLLNSEMARENVGSEPSVLPSGAPASILHYGPGKDPIPPEILMAGKGLHDDIRMNGRVYAVLLQGDGPQARAVAVDASGIEQREHDLARDVALTVSALMILFGLAGAWGVHRALRPLNKLVEGISTLDPSARDELPGYPPGSTAELRTVADAVNAYARRNREFNGREQSFVHMASHELRTPVAVLRNELELATMAEEPSQIQTRLQRAQSVTQGLEEMLNVLLTLARDPQRLRKLNEPVDLGDIARRQIADHAMLLREKELAVQLIAPDIVTVDAPPQLAEIAIANLIRNATENSDRGEIRVEIVPGGVVRVHDPGHGMSPREISELYARIARGHGDTRSGIGLQLLARICEHLGWDLRYTDSSEGGTTAELHFSSGTDSAVT